MELVIIEGAGKIKKTTHILKEIGKEAKVFATCGHIEKLRDNEYDQTGISHDLQFNFEWINGKSSIMKQINDTGAYAQNIWIATDPDREGEGIAWHIFNKLNTSNKSKTKRITFNEISKKAIDEAFKNQRTIDINYVNAYLSRVALDKKIGYGLSKYLQQTISLPSAGRVQSVVLKLLFERENEIKNFTPRTYYTFLPKINSIELKHTKTYNELGLFTNHLLNPLSFYNLTDVKNYFNDCLSNNQYKLIHISDSKIKNTYPPKPFKTSTIQAELIKELKINSKQAEKILQNLYQLGLITYPRTDSTRMSLDFCQEAYDFVVSKWPTLANNEFKFNKNSGGVQDAHEAIRVLHISDSIGKDLIDFQEKDAYKIIYNQTIIQFMNPISTEEVEYTFINNKDEFSTNSIKVLDQGFNTYLKKEKTEKSIDFILDQIYQVDNHNNLIKATTTTPPSPFTQSNLIKELEKLGIGRPSTYASAVEVNNLRKYSIINKNEILEITDLGRKAAQLLNDNWAELINYTFTANMEESLDKIADGKCDYKDYLKIFIDEFENKLYQSVSLSKNTNIQEVVGVCPKCNSPLITKETKTGKTIKECSKRKYNYKTKKTSGCDYVEWNNG